MDQTSREVPAGAVTLADFQRLIRTMYFKKDVARGIEGTFMWLIEEVGELATALHGDDQANKEEEFADVFAWLCTLANISGVDLEGACQKYIDETRVQGFK